jgi:hypothetical protein
MKSERFVERQGSKRTHISALSLPVNKPEFDDTLGIYTYFICTKS